jgi:cell division inhibitor SepF
MPEVFKKAAAWLGLVETDRFEYEASDDTFKQPLDRPKEKEPAKKPTEPVQPQTRTKAKPKPAPSADDGQPKRVLTGEETVVASHEDLPAAEPRPVVVPKIKTPERVRPVVVTGQRYDDVIQVAHRYRAKTPVAMALSGVPRPEAKRMIDFASGLVFGTDGHISKIAPMTFLLVPKDVRVSAEDQAKLIAELTIGA